MGSTGEALSPLTDADSAGLAPWRFGRRRPSPHVSRTLL